MILNRYLIFLTDQDQCCHDLLDLASDGPTGDKWEDYLSVFTYHQLGSNGVKIYMNSENKYLFFDVTYGLWLVS